MEIWQTILVSLLSGGSVAWAILELFVKDKARVVVREELKTVIENINKNLGNYTTNEDMQIERKELLEEVERRFLEKVAFQEFTKRFDDKFEGMSKTLDKVVENQEHIKDYIIRRGEL